jgi:hypothetical protein
MAAATGSGRWSKEPGRNSERRSDGNRKNNALCAGAQKVDVPFASITAAFFKRAVWKRDNAGGKKPQNPECFKIISAWSRADVYTCGKVDEK